MTISQYNRRNFLSSIAILSVGTTFGSTIKHFSTGDATNDLQKNWAAFWKKSGGRVYTLADPDGSNNKMETKGHHYKNGEIIYFPKENILAQPTWISWKGRTKPADLLVTLFENNHSFKKIIRFNRYEMDALYRISNETGSEQLLVASCNNSKPFAGASTVITSKTSIKKKSHIQEIRYYKGELLIFEDKIIHHT